MKRAFEFLRLIDPHDGNLSLTNIALMIVIVKLGFIQDAGLIDVGALLLALANYNFKKYLNQGAAPQVVTDTDLERKVDEMRSKLNGVMLKLGITKQ